MSGVLGDHGAKGRLGARLRGLHSWPPARQIAVILGLALPAQTVVFAIMLMGWRGMGEYLNLGLLLDSFLLWTLVTAVMAGIAWAVDRRGHPAPWTVYMLIFGYGSMIALNIQISGTFFSPLAMWLPAVLVLIFSVFGTRPGFVTAGVIVLILVSFGVLELSGTLAVAPLLKKREFAAYDQFAFYSVYIAVIIAILFFTGGVSLLSARAREMHHEELKTVNFQLAYHSEQLALGNALIRRYVPASVAEELLSGHVTNIESNRRAKLTVFFSDLVDFTARVERFAPNELATLLNEYLSEMAMISHQHGGTIDKFVGDSVMVFFGAPNAIDDREQARRAVSMALSMSKRLNELAQRWQDYGLAPAIKARMGINTGMANVGNFGAPHRLDYTAVGTQVNIAARIREHCTPGSVLVSHSTWALVKNEFPFVERESLSLRGVHYPVHAYMLRPPAG